MSDADFTPGREPHSVAASKFENLLRFDKDITMRLVAYFFGTLCICNYAIRQRTVSCNQCTPTLHSIVLYCIVLKC